MSIVHSNNRNPNNNLIIRSENLKKWFEVRESFLSSLLRSQSKNFIKAVDGISIDIKEGEIFAIVGESGCGKTTLGRLILQVEKLTDGKMFFKNNDIDLMKPQQIKNLKTKIQMIFQDPYGSLNSTMNTKEIISEPLKIHKIYNSMKEEEDKVIQAMKDVGLTPVEDYLKRYPHELSGGQRQRVVIAAALVLDPELLIADEPVSMLDVSIRGQILKLLTEIRREKNITILLITHNLAVARQISDRIAVVYLGKIVETGPSRLILQNPKHPYTKALVSVVPNTDPSKNKKKIILKGEIPSPINLPIGCRFHPRCPFTIEKCRQNEPELDQISPNQSVACLRVNEIDDLI